MTPNEKQKLTLYQPAIYQIKVPGILHEHWSDWYEGITITLESDEYSRPLSTLIGYVDQAALQGILRRLYSLGHPLISVKWVDND